MGVRTAGSGINPSITLIDVCESWNGYHNTAAGNPNGSLSDLRSPVDLGAGSGSAQMFPGVTGAVGPLAYDANIGRVAHVWTSLAATSAINAQLAAGNWGVPAYQKFNTLVQIPATMYPHPFRRFRMDWLVRGIIGPGAGADCACGISMNVSGAMVGVGNEPFMAWVARNGVNAGRWTPRFRLVNAGAVTAGTDSGIPFIPIAPLVFTQLSIIYEEGLVPRMRWLANGAEVFQLAGDANMMTNVGGSTFWAKVVGPGAGLTQSQWCESRLRVEEIG